MGTTRDIRDTKQSYHLDYQKANVRRGRMRGEIHFRIRYEMYASHWYDYLFLSEENFGKLAEGTGWRRDKAIYGEGGFRGTSYLAVLCKA